MKRVPNSVFEQRVKDKKFVGLTVDISTYTLMRNKVSVTCPVHGTFDVLAYALLNYTDNTCPKCSWVKTGKDVASSLTPAQRSEFAVLGAEAAKKLAEEGKIKVGRPRSG